MRRDRLGKWLIPAPPTLYLIVFFAIPALIMVIASFRIPGDYGGLAPLVGASGKLNLTFDGYVRFAREAIYIELFAKSFWYALLTTAICLVMAYPLAMLIAASPKRFRSLMILLVILPFWSNFLIRVYAWMILLGPQSAFATMVNGLLHALGLGPVRLLFSPFAVLVCLVYVNLPFMVLPLYANLEKHDPALLDAARDLGANPFRRFWSITFPLSLPGVFAGAALVFIPAFGIFAVPDILGGTEGIMIGNLIKQQFLETRDWPFGGVLSIVLTVVALGFAGIAAWFAMPRAKAI